MTLPHSTDGLPALLGGRPAFPAGLPLVRPALPDPELLADDLRTIVESRVLTNGPYVRELERRAAVELGVRHCIAVSSCTTGLMLLLRAADLSGEVIVPSFTFAATAHAPTWNGLRPVFCDIDPATLTLSASAARNAARLRSSAILATHTFGTPCDIEGLTELAASAGLRLFFDAAHAFGSLHGGLPVGGFGDGEVFSLSPTKVVVAGEGGIIATNQDLLAERCRIGRDYGNPGDYDCRFVGLNARMSEIHAATALRSLDGLEARLFRRNELARLYRESLAGVPGLSFPTVPEGDRSTYKDLTVLVEPEEFGYSADALASALAAEGVDTRRYYTPPLHRMRAYRHAGRADALPVTEQVAARVLTLPLWSDMDDDEVLAVAEAIRRIHRFRIMTAGQRSHA
ncbi:MAG: DegT/DnrJ/EryC1/StrS family aminotransferase [Actinomycetota bacterium]